MAIEKKKERWHTDPVALTISLDLPRNSTNNILVLDALFTLFILQFGLSCLRGHDSYYNYFFSLLHMKYTRDIFFQKSEGNKPETHHRLQSERGFKKCVGKESRQNCTSRSKYLSPF